MADRNLSLQNQTSQMFNGSGVDNNYTRHGNDIDTGFDFSGIVWAIISLVGLVGNSITSVVLFQLAKSSFYLYLALLSLSDIASIALVSTSILLELTAENPIQITCSLFEAGLRIFSHLSSWITVAATVDRYIAVCHPFKVMKYCTRKRAFIVVGAAFLVIVALNFPVVCLEWNDDHSSCITPAFTDDYCFGYGFYIDMSNYVLIPFLIISILNILMIRKSTVTAFFILCFLPFIGISLFAIVYNKSWDGVMELIPVPYTIAYTCAAINHSFNFVLYGLFGQPFRKRFVEMFCFRRFVQD
ncbi:FMRFamide receptor-like [Pecten maximus]|uniref:FMRFamide receptor-like n=1 Tax=Pecten maximus TaxID=6579 RepID=UPI001458A6F5|nr:FMRFamide receptor-like [Pecten maximus]